MIEIEVKGFESNLDHQNHKGHVLQVEHPAQEVAEDAGLDRDRVNPTVDAAPTPTENRIEVPDHQDHKGDVLQAEHPAPEVAEGAGLDRDRVNATVDPDRTLRRRHSAHPPDPGTLYGLLLREQCWWHLY